NVDASLATADVETAPSGVEEYIVSVAAAHQIAGRLSVVRIEYHKPRRAPKHRGDGAARLIEREGEVGGQVRHSPRRRLPGCTQVNDSNLPRVWHVHRCVVTDRIDLEALRMRCQSDAATNCAA